jgi:anti-sigma B factor antagonist
MPDSSPEEDTGVATATDPSEGPVDPTAPDFPSDTPIHAPAGSAEDLEPSSVDPLLRLSVQHPAEGIRVVTVDGELDMVTAPLLDRYLDDQLATAPAHLILNLQGVTFMGSSGINSLLRADGLTHLSTRTQLHLAGLTSQAVARPLEITGLLERFDTYPTVTQALGALTG